MVQKIAMNTDQDSNYVFEAVYMAVDPVALPGVYCQTCKYFIENRIKCAAHEYQQVASTGYGKNAAYNQSPLKASITDFPKRSNSGPCFNIPPYLYC